MSFFTSLGILILVSLIQASMQLSSSIFMIFYHYASGKYSHKKADSFALSYILGVETFTTILFISINTIYFSIFYRFPDLELRIFPWIMAGIVIAFCLISFFFYFRKSRGTELFIYRKFSRNLFSRTKSVKTRTDAFMLGSFSGIAELGFTLPLYVLAVVAINHFTILPRSPFSILFILSSIIPTITIFILYHTNHNIAEIERSRVKNKPFFRFIIPLGYALLAFALISMELIK